MRKIVIVPIFNEGYLLPYWIPNICETIKPDIVILNEGLFPCGSESRSKFSDDFYMLYTSDGKCRSFDLDFVQDTLSVLSNVYRDTDFQVNLMNYPEGTHTENVYVMAYRFGLPNDMRSDDVVFPIEADLFIHHDDVKELQKAIKKAEPEELGLTSFKRYFVSPFIRIYPDKIRKLFVKWGEGMGYHQFTKDLFLDLYQRRGCLHPVRSYHYEWVRGGGMYWKSRMAMFRDSLDDTFYKWHDDIKDKIFTRGSLPLPLGTDKALLVDDFSEDHPVQFKRHPDYAYFLRRIKNE